MEKHKYTGNTANGAVRSVLRCFNWAADEGYIPRNPVKGVKKPPATSRQCYIDEDQWKRLVSLIDGPFLDLVTILRETGCRPQEARCVEARHFDRKLSAWVFPREESKGRKRERVVPLNRTALTLTQRLALKYPEGPLFRNTEGKPWTSNAIRCQFRKVRDALGFDDCAYAIRHTFVTDALIRGVEPMPLATIVGHANIDMIWEVYNKIRMRHDHIRQALKLATGETG
jgi:integrase